MRVLSNSGSLGARRGPEAGARAMVPRVAPCCSPSRHAARGGEDRARSVAPRAVWDDTDSMTLADMKAHMDAALKVEDYQQAARLRDAIARKEIDGRLAIEDANARFYDAFMSGSLEQMGAVWGEGEHVQVIHPGCGCIAGRASVMESWRTILAGVRPRAFRIDLEDVRVFAGQGVGYVTCVEIVDADDSAGRICATNVFEKDSSGKWKLVLHQGGQAPPIVRAPRKPQQRRA
ncbi:hypothetical protein FOA52_013149 [Chlamydomonas sp. UWO 241]|nr:hypothetical protein FOA52_013149 [Chlamydomonas sp. UWO 241]